MAGALFVLLIAIPVAELWVIVQVSEQIGFLNTLGLLILISIGGAWLLRQQGVATWKRLQDTLARGEMPGKEVTDAFLVMLGGALLLTPGFITDVVGLLLLLPPTRVLLKGTTRRILARWGNRRYGDAPRRIYSATVIRSERRDEGPNPPALGETPPRDGGPPSGDGSRGTG